MHVDDTHTLKIFPTTQALQPPTKPTTHPNVDFHVHKVFRSVLQPLLIQLSPQPHHLQLQTLTGSSGLAFLHTQHQRTVQQLHGTRMYTLLMLHIISFRS